MPPLRRSRIRYSLLCSWQGCNDPRLCLKNFWYLSKSVQFLMLNKTRVVPSLKNFLGYPGRGCFGQNFHKKSQNFFLLESALCWTLYREKIWSSASFHQISSKSMQHVLVIFMILSVKNQSRWKFFSNNLALKIYNSWTAGPTMPNFFVLLRVL